MTYLRHSSRAVRKTVSDYIQAEVAALGWTDPATTPFNAPVADFITSIPRDYESWRQMEPGKVAITFGDEENPAEEELGGPLHSFMLTTFVDVYMEKDAHALTLASDIKDKLLGRDGGKRVHTVTDPATGLTVDDWQMEIYSVTMGRMEGFLAWYVITAMFEVRYHEA